MAHVRQELRLRLCGMQSVVSGDLQRRLCLSALIDLSAQAFCREVKARQNADLQEP